MPSEFDLALGVPAGLACAAWAYLLLLRGGFWRDGPYLDVRATSSSTWPEVVAVIPARNEAETIGSAVRSLIAQDYPGAFSIFIIDDQSDDDTAGHARAAASDLDRLSIVPGAPLPPAWTGKMWAVAQGIEAAFREHPEAGYVLLTDADIRHESNVLRMLVAKARGENRALVSLMVKLRCEGSWERLLIPAFVFFFKKLYPFAWVNDPQHATAGAAGGCILVRKDALEAIGGIARLRGEIIDDCAMARAVKPVGSIWLGLTRQSISLRRYDHLADIWNMVARTAFVQLRFSYLMLAGTILGLVAIYLVPPAALTYGLVSGSPGVGIAGAASWLAMSVAYRPTLRLYQLPSWHAALLPISALLYSLMTFASALKYATGRGLQWKNRHYGAGEDVRASGNGR